MYSEPAAAADGVVGAEYARRLLRTLGLQTKESILQGDATDPAYIGPQNALEAGIATLYKYRSLGNMVIRPDGTTAIQVPAGWPKEE